MNLPDKVREELRGRLWARADEIGWTDLSPSAKSQHYENWTLDPKVGGILSHYIDKGQVRVYLKDTLLKDYARKQSADEARPFRILGIEPGTRVSANYIKPHGRRLQDGRIMCWGRAADWKSIMLAVHERTFQNQGARPFAALLTHAVGKYKQDQLRAMIEDAARKLGIERVAWIES
jgi:hypothetical protein